MPRLIDTHAHLDSPIFDRDLDIVVRHALDDDIWAVTVGTDLNSSRRAVEIAERYPRGVFASVGLHPLRVSATELAPDKLIDLESYRELTSHPKVVAVGECGLDFHDLPDSKDPRDRQIAERVVANQKKVFAAFLDLSRDARLPMLLHCREAHDDMLGILETWDKTTKGFDSRGVIHCFSGNWKQARRYFNLDIMISVTGIVTHGDYQAEILTKAPLNRLVAESDCPYLTPSPWSIRRNEPRYVESVAARIAGIRKMDAKEVERQLTKNALSIFKRMAR